MITPIEQFRTMKARTQEAPHKASAAFTLTELMMATTISGLVLASIISTFLVFAVGSKSVGAYTMMSQDSRLVLEYFARDMRSAEDVTQAGADTLAVRTPNSSFYNGNSITYEFDEDTKLLSRIVEDSSGTEISNKTLLEGVEQFTFSYFGPLGAELNLNTASILLSVKSVQVDAEMRRSISRTEATDYIISARFMMRNRPVTE